MNPPRAHTVVSRRRLIRGVLTVMALIPLLQAANPLPVWKGLPYIRVFPFDEIGDISSGAELSFDKNGRLAIVQNGFCIVLNDDSWINVADGGAAHLQIRHMAVDNGGQGYFGSVGAWGILEQTASGQLRPKPLSQTGDPQWTSAVEFKQIIPTCNGVCFAGWNGVLFWDRVTGRTTFCEVAGISRVFLLDGDLWVSGHEFGSKRFNIEMGRLEDPSSAQWKNVVVENVAYLSSGATLLSTTERRLLRYQNGQIIPLPGFWAGETGGRISSLQMLSDGRIAVSVLGVGLFFINEAGDVENCLSDPESRSISTLAANEPGVLWAANDTGIQKILYGAPLTRVTQTLGLHIGWPQLVVWDGKLLATSNGRIFESFETGPGAPQHFKVMPDQPQVGGWGLAAWKEWLLIGNGDGVYAKRKGGEFEHILKGIAVARLVILEPGLCLAIGDKAIAALSFDAKSWHECADRVEGIGYPATTLTTKNSVWLEIGANVAGRISLENGKIITRIFKQYPWKSPHWIHISALGNTIILSGPEGGRIYFDESDQTLKEEAPDEACLRARTQYWPYRFLRDSKGEVWISHQHGVSVLHASGESFVENGESYRNIDETNPRIHLLPSDVVAVSTGNSLFFLESDVRKPSESQFQPKVVAAKDNRSSRDMLYEGLFSGKTALPYNRNSFSLRFFSGSYASRRTPHYEARINGANWEHIEGSVLNLSNLHEGDYSIDIRAMDSRGTLGRQQTVTFAVLPPWNRTWQAYAALTILIGLSLFGIGRLLVRRAKRQNEILEKLVSEKTEQLRVTMDKLEKEARVTATLEERSRLAGEIHDSLEQGFSALSLQLETTASLKDCPPSVRNGLSLARSMVSFSRDEVRNAVWDLHSPRLDDGGLVGALERLVAQTVPAGIDSNLKVTGTPSPLGTKVEHHLLRIAQEALANAIKHGCAKKITTSLDFADSGTTLTIIDDGKGFEPQAATTQQVGRFGLKDLKTRAKAIDAIMDIQSQLQVGTTVRIFVPKDPNNTPLSHAY